MYVCMDTSHSGIIMVKYISCNGRSLGFKVYFFSFFQNIYLKHASSVFHKFENYHSSRNCGTILFSRSSSRRVYFHQIFFECCLIKSTHPEVFFNEIWNIHRVFFWNSCSEYFREIPRKTSATKLTISIVMSFQHALW